MDRELTTRDFCEHLHATKYRLRGESFRECCNRIASALRRDDAHYKRFRDILLARRFLPGGRIQAAVGSSRQVTAYNCLAAETPIITIEHGVSYIGSLCNQNVTVLDGDGKPVQTRVTSYGKQLLHEVVFTKGRQKRVVYATAQHGWITTDGRKTTWQLRRGMKLTQPDAHPDWHPNAEDYRLGVLHGLVYGDGTTMSRSSGFQLRLCAKHDSLMHFLDGIPCSYPPSYNGDPIYYFAGENAFCNMKALPINKSCSYMLGFFRGWFAADGCVSKSREVLLTCDYEGLMWLSIYAPTFGIHIVGFSKLSDTTNFGYRKKDTYNVRLDRATLSIQDFLVHEHTENFRPAVSPLWRVKSITPTDRREEVFCCTVPTTGSFLLEGGIHSGNCFVSGTIADSLTSGSGSIMARATEAATTLRLGGGIGYDFSTLRPRGETIKSLGSQSTGPISFMDIFNSICLCIASAGHRRGAQMAVLRIDHPDIEEFIASKQNTSRLTGFNISVAVTDEFMECLQFRRPFPLRFGGKTYRTIDPNVLWEKLMRATWDWAEPGILFIDTINRKNPLAYCETIAATNPCGEQPLPPFGACLLGSFNLVAYLRPTPSSPNGAYWAFDMEAFRADIPVVVSAMDRVIDISIYPLEEQKQEAISKRRMGLGITGAANALEALGHTYGSETFCNKLREILYTLRVEATKASAELAQRLGSFPLFNKDLYLETESARSLPPKVRDLIAGSGLRNSHLTSIAPTGTISLAAGNISSGIEPVYAISQVRTINLPDGERTVELLDYGFEQLSMENPKTSEVCSVWDHLNVLRAASEYVDSAVSKTLNVGPEVTWKEFKNIYRRAHLLGLKGCTTFRASGKRGGILQAATTDSPEAATSETTVCIFNPETGERECE